MAAEIFARRPVASVSVEDLTREAGIAKGTFYLYFGSKNELLDEVFLPRTAALAKAIGEGEERPRISTIANNLLRFFSDDRLFLGELRSAWRESSDAAWVLAARRSFAPMARRWFKHDPRFPVLELEIYSEFIVGSVLDLCYARCVEATIPTDAEAVAMLGDFLKRFFDCEP